MEVMPVTLPPGWLKLATRPAWLLRARRERPRRSSAAE